MTEYQPPHAPESEKIVLGAAMSSLDAATAASRMLRPQDFYVARHMVIFAAIVSALASGHPADLAAIADRLAVSGDLAKMGGAPYLYDLAASVPLIAHLPYHARIVSRHADMRRLIDAGQATARMAMTADNETQPSDIAATATRLIADALTGHDTSGLVHIAELLNPALESIERNSKEGKNPGLETGITLIDNLTGGLRPGQLIIVAGRPGMGKSVMALQIAANAALRQQKPAAFFSLEMSNQELINRLVSAETNIELNLISKNWLSPAEWQTISHHAGRISEQPLYFDDTASLNITQLVDRARRVHSRTPLSLIVVDYLQLMKPTMRNGNVANREREVAEISRGLKVMAKELAVPVIAAAQLNRNVEHRSEKVPTMSDLRESGSLENDADIAMLLHRPGYYDQKSPRGNEMDIILAKNRHGPQGVVVVATAKFEYSRIENNPAANARIRNGAQ